ncbi:MAG: 30S ribosomal protein S18, partial [Pseudomonadota bacterium]|nr:30S ribosomal protein S18 [Pseudomonadota bacterium]
MSFKKKFAPRRKYCRFCENPEIPLNYKHPEVLND